MLNHRQQTFIQEFLKSGKATASYKIAYGTDNDNEAAAAASRLLRNVKIIEEINKFKSTMEQQTGITLEATVKRIAALSESAERDSDKLRALNMLMLHLGGYVSVQDVVDKLTPEQAESLTEKILSKIKDK